VLDLLLRAIGCCELQNLHPCWSSASETFGARRGYRRRRVRVPAKSASRGTAGPGFAYLRILVLLLPPRDAHEREQTRPNRWAIRNVYSAPTLPGLRATWGEPPVGVATNVPRSVGRLTRWRFSARGSEVRASGESGWMMRVDEHWQICQPTRVRPEDLFFV